MEFVLVNGRTPRPQSFCALCCEPIGAAICEKSGRDSPIAITIATSITARTPSWLSKIQGRKTFRVIGDPSRFAETKTKIFRGMFQVKRS